ncbi:MAG TPA: hypothetical protein DDY13_10125 [Cytophagales bacterium]|nr:hypothetical protein [Cytophagales bacterium]
MKSVKVVALLSLIFAVSCSSSNTEKRLQNLEKRVAELEKNSRPLVSSALKNNNIESVSANENLIASSIKFDDAEFDFGTIKEGDVVEHTFKFVNDGEEPLIIQKATASCGCTVPSWPKEPISPGESGEIQVRFDSKGKPNQQTKRITITANTNPPVTRLTIKGMVTPAS